MELKNVPAALVVRAWTQDIAPASQTCLHDSESEFSRRGKGGLPSPSGGSGEGVAVPWHLGTAYDAWCLEYRCRNQQCVCRGTGWRWLICGTALRQGLGWSFQPLGLLEIVRAAREPSDTCVSLMLSEVFVLSYFFVQQRILT